MGSFSVSLMRRSAALSTDCQLQFTEFSNACKGKTAVGLCFIIIPIYVDV